MVTAEEDQIVQIGGSSISPMSSMMGMYEVSAATARPLTASVSMPELMTQPGRDQTGTTTDPEHFPVVIDHTFDGSDHRRVGGRSRWR